MTMAKVENGEITQVGLPSEERGTKLADLHKAGWLTIKGTARPTETPEAGYQWTYGAPWSVDGDSVTGTWSQTQRPQPYPSWSWVDDQGWVPPVPKPDGDYTWDEETQSWVAEAAQA